MKEIQTVCKNIMHLAYVFIRMPYMYLVILDKHEHIQRYIYPIWKPLYHNTNSPTDMPAIIKYIQT